jgi:hypothetical protein
MATFRKLSRCLLQFYCRTPDPTKHLRLLAIGMFAAAMIYSDPGGQSVTPASALTVEEIVKLSRAGFSEELIVTKIKKNGKAFDLSTEELLELKKQGLSDSVIRVLLDPNQAYTPPAAPSVASVVPSKIYPPDRLASLVPADPGLYFFAGNSPSRVDLKVVLGMRKGKLLKGKPTSYLAGPSAKLRVKPGQPIFYLRFPEGKEASDLILIGLQEKEDRREFNGLPGPKGGLNADDVLQFDPLEVGAKLFKLTPPALVAGEYVFFLVGSAELDKGTYGKGYDFGVDAKPGEKNSATPNVKQHD